MSHSDSVMEPKVQMFFMDECLEKMMNKIDSEELDLNNLILSERLSKLLRIRLEMQAPYISKWAEGLSIQFHRLL
ncbi:hypothetical protein Taro_010693 [Colocasia esculenta]|uniref:Uncharacterized protein n=1 Tax=Colocasia esculenta TaxID=4460 RepID=A0A843U420_COLES|nr:hypothetical protein [Colocasia esculenta]